MFSHLVPLGWLDGSQRAQTHTKGWFRYLMSSNLTLGGGHANARSNTAKLLFLYSKHMCLTQNSLRNQNVPFAFCILCLELPNIETEIMMSDLTHFMMLLNAKNEHLYTIWHVCSLCLLGCIECPEVFKTLCLLFYFVPLIA